MATTSTFSLRKLIQTRLHQDDEASAAITDDDTASSSTCHDDHNTPIKKRLTTWLAPGRRGSTSSAARGRSSLDFQCSGQRSRSPWPAAAQQPTDQAQQLSLTPESTSTISAKMADPKRRTLNDVPSHSSLGRNDDARSDYFGAASPHAHADKKKRPRPKTFLASPTPSSIFDPVSPQPSFNGSQQHTGPAATPSSSDQPDDMDTSLQNKSDPTLNRQSLQRDWSEGVEELIKATDLAFEGVGSSFAKSGGLDIPRLSNDMSSSNPDLTALAPKPLVVDKESSPEGKENVGPKAEMQLDVPPRRSSQRDAVLKAERRKSRSVPPPIQVRAASPPPGQGVSSPRQIPPAPKSATHNTNDNSCNKTPAFKPSAVIRKGTEKQSHFAPRRASKSTRWAFPENVSDLLTGRNVFKKTDVDEILTPEELEKLKREREEKQRRESESKPPPPPKDEPNPSTKPEAKVEEPIREEPAKEAAEETSSKDEKTPGLHERGPSLQSKFSHKSRPSESRTTRSDAAAHADPSSSEDRTSVDTNATSVFEEEKPPVPRKNSSRPHRRANTTEEEEASGNEADDDSDSDGLATYDFLGDGPSPLSLPQEPKFPAPPPKNPGRYSPPMRDLPALPTKSALRAKRRKSSARKTLKGEEDEKFYYLKSTPYSITAPCFKHGPIAFTKNDIGRGAMTMDDTLDWTAFQMAILGAGEFLPDMYDEGDSKLADELKDWFHEFGFETHGVLVPEAWPSPRCSQSTISSTGSADHDHDHPVKDNSGYDTTKFYRGNGFSKRWTMEGKPKDNSGSKSNHKRNVSTPDARSPLIVDNEDGKVSPAHQEEARMGFNLQGDLGDFLQWEAQHAYAGGYFGGH